MCMSTLLDEDLAKFAVEKASSLGADYAEARLQCDSLTRLSLKNGELEPPALASYAGIAVRVICNGALGFAATNSLNRDSVSATVERAVGMASAASSSVKQPVRMAPAKTVTVEFRVEEKVKFENVPLSDIISLLEEVDGAVLASARDVKFPARLITVAHYETEKLFVNSEGTSVRSLVPRTSFELFLTAFSQQRGTAQRFLHLGSAKGWEAIGEWGVVGRSSEEAEKLARILMEAVSIPSAKMDVVVGPEVAGIIAHESIGHPIEADRILGREAAQAGESYITRDYIGKRIGSDEDYVSDDPTIPGSFGFYLYDDEGVKARKRRLVEAGVVKEFLHNRETAAEMGVESNGSARAMSYAYEPIVRMANTYFEPGDYSFEELIEDVDFGVFINNFMEWNIDDRRVNQRYVGLEAYLIEGGKLTKLVRNPVIEVTTFDLHKSLDARGRDLEMFAAICGKGDPAQGAPVFTGGPSLRFRSLFVSCR